MPKLYKMINPFLSFNLTNQATKVKSQGVIHMSSIESVLDNNGMATIYSTSGVVYPTTSKWLTVMALWQKYDREMQETFSVDEPDFPEDEEDDDVEDAEMFEA